MAGTASIAFWLDRTWVQVAQEPANPIKLADVNPDISKRRGQRNSCCCKNMIRIYFQIVQLAPTLLETSATQAATHAPDRVDSGGSSAESSCVSWKDTEEFHLEFLILCRFVECGINLIYCIRFWPDTCRDLYDFIPFDFGKGLWWSMSQGVKLWVPAAGQAAWFGRSFLKFGMQHHCHWTRTGYDRRSLKIKDVHWFSFLSALADMHDSMGCSNSAAFRVVSRCKTFGPPAGVQA